MINYDTLFRWERKQIMFDGYGTPPTKEPTMADYVKRIHPKAPMPDDYEIVASNAEVVVTIETPFGPKNLRTRLPWVVNFRGDRGILFPRPMSRITANTPTILYWEREVMWAAHLQRLRPDVLGTRRFGWASGTGKTNWKKKSHKTAQLLLYPDHVLAGVVEATEDAMCRYYKSKAKNRSNPNG